MRTLSARLVLSHVLVAVLGGLATFLVVRLLAPTLFDESLRRAQMQGGQGRWGQASGTGLRDQFALAVDQALVLGSLVGVVVAAVFGVLAAVRVAHSLRRVRAATRRMARGQYDARVPVPAETELAELAADVNTLGTALAEAEKRRVRLVGEVAHELRTPLTVIDGYVEGMIDGVLPADAASLGQVQDETRRLRRLAEDLSTLSRAEEGRIQLALAVSDLRGVVEAAAERLRPQAEDAGLQLTCSTPGSPVRVEADADRIAQVVTNLVGNAIRATPAGGTVTVRCSTDGARAVVAVTDTGEGLDPAHLDRVFERFYRVPGRRTSPTDSGSGIGLTIARGLARAHGGDLTASSPGPGGGATFTLTLPLAASA